MGGSIALQEAIDLGVNLGDVQMIPGSRPETYYIVRITVAIRTNEIV